MSATTVTANPTPLRDFMAASIPVLLEAVSSMAAMP
jgi:hypothetical protein